MKKLLVFSLLAVVLFGGCDILISNSNGIEYDEGTVKFIDLEGGFWGIITFKDEHYDVINLPDEFKVDGLKVKFLYKLTNDQVSVHMWGKIIEIIEISKL